MCFLLWDPYILEGFQDLISVHIELLLCIKAQFYTTLLIWSFNYCEPKEIIVETIDSLHALVSGSSCFCSSSSALPQVKTSYFPLSAHICMFYWLVSCLSCNYNWPGVYWVWLKRPVISSSHKQYILSGRQLHNYFVMRTWAFVLLKIQIPRPHNGNYDLAILGLSPWISIFKKFKVILTCR